MMGSSFRSIGFAPLSCAILGAVLTLGTVVGQEDSAPADSAAAGPMAGMDHSGMGGMDHSAMSGMDHSQMDGMDHSSPTQGKPATTSTGAESEHGMSTDMPGSAATAGGHAEMDMSQPGMAATMPQGFHASCATKATCTVVFAQGASGVASLLGVKARLQKLTGSSARVLVGKKPLVLRAGKAVNYRGLTWKVVRMDTAEVSIKVQRTP